MADDRGFSSDSQAEKDRIFGPANKTDMRNAQKRPENQRSTYADPPTPSSSTSKTSATQGSRTIVGLMFFATSFALIGNELEDKAGSPITSGSKIILGGIVATSLLTLVSHAGDTGRQFAVGVALVTTATSLLVFGGTPGNPGQVWKKLGAVVGTTKATTPTASTTATTPTTGAATTVALAKAA